MRKNLSHDITDFVNQHADIILPDDERQAQRKDEAIHFTIPETQNIEQDDDDQQQQQQQQEQQAVESVVLLVDNDEQVMADTMTTSSQSVEAY